VLKWSHQVQFEGWKCEREREREQAKQRRAGETERLRAQASKKKTQEAKTFHRVQKTEKESE